MNENELKFQMRLYATELLVVNVFATHCLMTPNPQQLAAQVRQQMIEGTRRQTFPELDPAKSDLFSAELESAVDRLMEMANAQINVVLQAQKG
jgi:hypothetical protein